MSMSARIYLKALQVDVIEASIYRKKEASQWTKSKAAQQWI